MLGFVGFVVPNSSPEHAEDDNFRGILPKPGNSKIAGNSLIKVSN